MEEMLVQMVTLIRKWKHHCKEHERDQKSDKKQDHGDSNEIMVQYFCK